MTYTIIANTGGVTLRRREMATTKRGGRTTTTDMGVFHNVREAMNEILYDADEINLDTYVVKVEDLRNS